MAPHTTVSTTAPMNLSSPTRVTKSENSIRSTCVQNIVDQWSRIAPVSQIMGEWQLRTEGSVPVGSTVNHSVNGTWGWCLPFWRLRNRFLQNSFDKALWADQASTSWNRKKSDAYTYKLNSSLEHREVHCISNEEVRANRVVIPPYSLSLGGSDVCRFFLKS